MPQLLSRFLTLAGLFGLATTGWAHMPGSAARSPAQVSTPESTPRFLRRYIDLDYGGNGKPGWVRAGDMDSDGDRDIVAGGGYALFIYENNGQAGGWSRFGNLDGASAIGANGGELYDVDGDGDLDVVSARFNDDLGWWENPGGQLAHIPWSFHVLSNETRYLHDLIRVDLDSDGIAEEFIANLNQGYWSANITLKWFRPGTNPELIWEQHTIEASRNEGSAHGHAGLDVADIDGDGDQDLAYANGWYEGPTNPTGTWIWHAITGEYGISNILARDMDEDTDLDLVMGAGHHGYGVYWYERPADAVSGTWTRHEIDALLHHPECLQSVDLSADGDVDVVTCDLFFGEDPGEPDWSEEVHNIYLFENVSGVDGWSRTTISPTSFPSHQLQITDVNLDGRWDILSESAGTSVISYYENAHPDLAYHLDVVDPAYPGNGRPGWSTSGDIDGDGLMDVISGGGGAIQWYRAPDWARFPLESGSAAGGNGGIVTDVDRDGDLDIIAALYNSDLAWWQNPGPAAVTGTWTRRSIDGVINTFNHDLALGDIDADGEGEIVALYVGGGVYWYDIPFDPTIAGWPRTTILSNITHPNVGLALGDLDGDLDIDVVASSSWYERPVNPSTANWIGRNLFSDPVQNVAIFDVNGDSRLDVVGAEGFENPAGQIYWAQAPPDQQGSAWTEHLIADDLDGAENIWVGDLDADGLTDIVSGEMGTSTGFGDSDSNLFAFLGQDSDGLVWERRDLAWGIGVSARIQSTDIDGDGGIDFVADGNAEDHIYLWRQEQDSPIFTDGFESGSTAAWNRTVP